MNLGAGLELVVTEFPVAHGPADYLLNVGGRAIGVVKAKPVDHTLKGLEGQSAIVEAVNEKLSQIDALDAEVERGLARASRHWQTILKAAFEVKLVPQDPTDEPASVLLERIEHEAESQRSVRRSRRHMRGQRNASLAVLAAASNSGPHGGVHSFRNRNAASRASFGT